MTASAQLPRRCWVEIDLAALERNLKLIRASLPPEIKYVAVVKADAYGHGLHHVAARLMHAGADLFAVANVAEALSLRELSGDWPILLLSPVLPEEDRYLADHDLAATVSSAEEVARFDAAGRAAGKPIAVHLKIDTGMGRLGVWHEQAGAVYERIRAAQGVCLAGVFTHFSSADEDPVFTAEQRRLFLATLQRFPGFDPAGLFIHADNSAGLESTPGQSVFNAVRVGLLQFGILPHPHSLLARVHPEPVFSFHTRVGLVKQLPAGTGISYGRTFKLKRPSTVAVLTAGYGDGLARASSNRAEVLIHGRRCPVLGRVTMDQTIVDITDIATPVHAGDAVVLVGRQNGVHISITEFSAWADSIPWETLCSVTKRVPRFYRTPLGI
ncbi:alanine racemase [Opitutus sp. GAS368]|jgi:alanine racemase|uniref:alanine racemase n=1 Tax=Opitutus sp. GAS368 TaxID=1882749 RepID=UPI00087C9B5C|nr:alanine racemase [Opitutus sp. GAS368]SDR66465.1 alanine racemase [Opitutus sp. GAS368]